MSVGKKHVRPRVVRVGRTKATENLYNREHDRSEAIRRAAVELAWVLDIPESEFWTRTMPQALFDTLESYEIGAGYVAAKAYVDWVRIQHPDVADLEDRGDSE